MRRIVFACIGLVFACNPVGAAGLDGAGSMWCQGGATRQNLSQPNKGTDAEASGTPSTVWLLPSDPASRWRDRAAACTK